MKPISFEEENHLIPYFSNYAVIGLSKAYTYTKEEKYLKAVDAWLTWYAKHINPDGTVYDYKGRSSKLITTGDYDSSDAYAGTFITAVWNRYLAKPDKAFLKKLYPAVKKAISAIKLTLQNDHLTFAKPNHPVKYLMDNIETWQGLFNASQIAKVLGYKEDEIYCVSLATRMLNSLEENFWDDEEKCYYFAIYSTGVKEGKLDKWYPEQMANLMAIAFLPHSHKREELYLSLKEKLNPFVEKDLEKLIWWSLSAKGAKVKEDLNLFLGKILQDDYLSLSPFLLGHLLTLLTGKAMVE